MNDQNLSAMIDTWLQFTLDNPLYVVALAATVFIITALLYSLRTGSLKKQLKLSEAARLANEKSLSNNKQQLQDAQQQLAVATAQVEDLQKSLSTEKQRAVELAQHISERNDKITTTVEKLTTHLDTGERPAISADFKAEELWQQHDKIVEQLIGNLKTVQLAKTELEDTLHQEKSKASDIETRLNSLQSQLDNQTQLITSLQSQNNVLHQQYSQSQNALNAALEQQKTATPLPADTLKPVVDDNAAQLKNLFKKPDTSLAASKPEPVVTVEPIVQASIAEEITMNVQEVITVEPAQTVAIANDNKASDAPIIEQIAVPKDAEPSIAPEKINKVKGWYQKFGKKTDTPTDTLPKATSSKEESEKTGLMQGLYQKLTNKTESDTHAETVMPAVAPKPVEQTAEARKTTAFSKPSNSKSNEAVEEDTGIEDFADKLTEKLERFSRFFSKKDED